MIRISLLDLAIVMLCGCRGSKGSIEPQPVRAAGEGVAGIIAHTESAERHVQNARPFSNDAGRFHLQAASDEHQEVFKDAQAVRGALNDSERRLAQLAEASRQQDAARQRLEGRWYVVWGRWIERVLWVVGVSWLVLGAIAILLGLGNPLGGGVRLGKELVRLLPAMNVFAWLRDAIARRRATKQG